jgi:hypothetical protein
VRWLAFGAILTVAMLAHAVARDAHADEPYCMEDLNHDHYIDIFDISIETGHYNEPQPIGSPYDLAPVPPDGFVDVINDISHLTGMYATECYGSHGETQGQATVSTGNEAQATMVTTFSCLWASGNRPIRPAASETMVWLRYAIQTWCYASGELDPLAFSNTCIAQVERNDPPDPQWYLVASSSGATATGGWCSIINQSVVPRFEMLRTRACWQLNYWGQLVVSDCRGAEFPFMLM